MKKSRFLIAVVLLVIMLAHPAAQAVSLPSEAVIDKVNTLVVTLIDENDSVYKRAKVMHDWLINNAYYDRTLTKGDPEDTLIKGTGVCQSYGLAYQQMMRASGLECIYLVSDEMNHAWNMIKVNDEWYHVDCTWDDPLSKDEAVSGDENDTHFMLTDEEIGRNHREWYVHTYYGDDGYYEGENVLNIDDPVPLGTLEELKDRLNRLAAAGGEEERYFSCTYDGKDSTFDAFSEWAWGEHDGFDIWTLWHGSKEIKVEVIWHYEAPESDGESLAKVQEDDSATAEKFGTLEEAKKTLERLAATGGTDRHLYSVSYDGTDEGWETIKSWAWSTHDGFRIHTLWHGSDSIQMQVFWGAETSYFYFENTADYIDVGDTTTVTIRDEVNTSGYVWTSSDERIATVDTNGVVTGKKPGEATITATSSCGATDSIRITVMAPMQADFDLTFTRTGSTSATLAWKSVPGVTEYRVYGMAAEDTSYRLFGVTEETTMPLALESGRQYRFYVRGVRLADGKVIAMHRSLGAGDLPGEEEYIAVYDYNTYIELNPDVASAYGNDHEAVLLHFLKNGMQEGRVAGDSFNVQYYRANYADLLAGFGDDLMKYYTHYIKHGQKEGRVADRLLNGNAQPDPSVDSREASYAAVYSYEYYIDRYPDIAAACQGSRSAAMDHFIKFGMAEGRHGNAEFNVNFYRANYADLQKAFGGNLEAYYRHYISAGKAEDRVADRLLTDKPESDSNTPDKRESYYAPVYDFDYYVNKYPDVAAAFGGNRTATLDHFINHGMAEGRRGSAEFSVKAYRANYADLNAAFGSDLANYYRHYINHGKAEGRKGK